MSKMFLKSLSFCQVCSKCPQCCQRAGCRGQTSEVLVEVGNTGSEPKDGLHLAGRLYPSIQNEAPPGQISSHQKWLCKSGQKSSSFRSSKCLNRKVGSRKGGCTDFPVLLQPPVPGPKTQQQVETNFGPQSIKCLSPDKYFQDGNSGDYQSLSSKRGVGHIGGFQRCSFSYPYPSKVQKVPKVLFEQQGISVHSPSLRSGHGSIGVHQGGQGNQTYGPAKGYKNPPVPR